MEAGGGIFIVPPLCCCCKHSCNCVGGNKGGQLWGGYANVCLSAAPDMGGPEESSLRVTTTCDPWRCPLLAPG